MKRATPAARASEASMLHNTAEESRVKRATEDLFAAIVRADVGGVVAALAGGADVNARGPSGGETPLMQVRLCRHASQVLPLLLRAGADPHVQDLAGRTALHHLTLCNDPAGVDAALRAGVDPEHRDNFGDRALDFALYSAPQASLERLLDAMAPLQAEDLTRLFIMAVQRDDEALALRWLLAGARVSAPTPQGYPPLYWAAERGNARVVDALIERGADVHARCGASETALHASARFGRTATVRRLIAAGVDVNCRNAMGETPLHVVAGRPALPARATASVVDALLEAGADPFLLDHYGYSPRARARQRGHVAALDLLPPAPREAATGPALATLHFVELAATQGARLRWYPNDVVYPFAIEEHIQRDEWGQRTYRAAELLELDDKYRAGLALGWLAPLLRPAAAGEPLDAAALLRAAEDVHGRPPYAETFAGRACAPSQYLEDSGRDRS